MTLLQMFNPLRFFSAQTATPQEVQVSTALHDQDHILFRAERATRFSKGHCALIEVSYLPMENGSEDASPYVTTSIQLNGLPVDGSYEIEEQSLVWRFLWDGVQLTPFQPKDFWSVESDGHLTFTKHNPDDSGVF